MDMFIWNMYIIVNVDISDFTIYMHINLNIVVWIFNAKTYICERIGTKERYV